MKRALAAVGTLLVLITTPLALTGQAQAQVASGAVATVAPHTAPTGVLAPVPLDDNWMPYAYYPDHGTCVQQGEQRTYGSDPLASDYECIYGGPPPFTRFWRLWLNVNI
jgi:hypothetical protein